MKECILTFDLGTTACKTVLFDLKGKVIDECQEEFNISQPKPGYAEHNPEDWWKALINTTGLIMNRAAQDIEIIAIGLSSQRETIVPVDSGGNNLANAILWMDQRSEGQARHLEKELGFDFIHQTTGMIPAPTFSATKILWIKENCGDVFQKAYKYLQPKDYICHKLTGEFVTDYSLASRTMMYNTKEKKWCDDILDILEINKEQLPEIISSKGIVGRLSKDASRDLGIGDGIPIIAGGGDRQCEALGVFLDDKTIMESTGTTSNMSCVIDTLEKKIDKRVVCSAHVLDNHWLFEQGMTTTGSILRWYRDNFCFPQTFIAELSGESEYSYIDKELEKTPPGASNLLLLPFFMGAKSTRWKSSAKGLLFGLSLQHTRAHVGRSILEGVAFELRACLDIIKEAGVNPHQIVAMGGGSRSRIWNQIKADITGKTYAIPKITSAASLGAMILAGCGVGLFDDPIQTAKDINITNKVYKPNAEVKDRYDELYSIYNELYTSIEPIYDKLEKCN